MSIQEPTDTTLRERIAANPQPALYWLAGVVVLVALEFARFVAGFVRAGGMARFGLERLATIPGRVGRTAESEMASILGGSGGEVAAAVGTSATILAALAMLLIAAIVIKWLLIPWTLVGRLNLELSPGAEALLERLLVTAVLGIAAAVLVLTPIGGVLETAIATATRGLDWLSSLPTLTSRNTIPNEGYRSPDGGWEGTFLGLSPAWAWALRVVVVYVYAFIWLGWLWKGYTVFREHYREADWTPRDDSVRRLRNHYWGLFGFIVVFMFIVMALWAQPLSPVSAEANLYSPYDHEIQYLSDGTVETITHGDANMDSRSQGAGGNVGPLSYDDYDRYHPIGTNQDGKDLFTFIAYGARVSLFIGLLATTLMAFTATALAMMTSYYKGALDFLTIIVSDSVMSLPRFLLVLLLSVLFMEAEHPIAEIYDGGLLLALIFAATGWPFLWRSVRGPSLQVAQEEWVDAAKSYGQTPTATMYKHMSPYIAGYMLVYASLTLGGVIIGVAALSFLGFGIQSPTPEWGRAVDEGRTFISTGSWHIATIPGILVVLVVTGFNALGDGIRDAIDPQSNSEDTDTEAAAAATGGGG